MSYQSDHPYHAFLSYSHEDRDVALKLRQWLTSDAGFKIWFDESHLKAGSPVATRLAEQMSLCRNFIVLASRNSVASTWVPAERDHALHFATENPQFGLLALRIDDCPLNQSWPSIAHKKWLDMPDGVLTPQIARELIDRLDGRISAGRQTELRNVYVSRGWRDIDLPFADAVCEALCARKWELRLVGDAPDQKDFVEERIRDIIGACTGHFVVLPRRGTGSEHDYRHFIRELEISNELGIPVVLLAEQGTSLPPKLASSAIGLRQGEDYCRTWIAEPPEWLYGFLEEKKVPPLPQHLFLAAEYKENMDRVARLRDFMEAVTGIPCQIGRDFEGQGLRNQIVTGITSACVVFANLVSVFDSDPKVSTVNSNTCVEAGIALGAHTIIGKKPLPVFLTAQFVHGEQKRTEKLPFMFTDDQITYYTSEAELLANIRRLLQPYRRRIMNYEFTKLV